jgi:hypothetical protein
MADPITIGALTASVLAIGAEAALKGAVGEAVKDAYKALKEKVAGWAGADVEALENAPTSTARQAVVAEEIDRQPFENQATLRVLVDALIVALKDCERYSPIGVDRGRLEAARIQLGEISVSEGIGFRAHEVKTLGSFEAGPIRVGQPAAGKS